MYKYLFLALLFIGCSTKPIIIEREIPVLIPALSDTITLQDTVILQDTVWYGDVNDSLGNVIGELKVYYQRKIAELKLNKRVDTVTVIDTIPIPKNKTIEVMSGLLNWWEEGILALVLALLLFWKIKRV